MDPYAVLGVGVAASEAEITRAYRRLALQHHPDRNGGSDAAAARFREITAAYDVLRRQRANAPRRSKPHVGERRQWRELDPERIERVRRRLPKLNDALRTAIDRPSIDALESLVDVARWARLDVDDALALKGHVADLRDAAWRELTFTTARESTEIFRRFLDAPTTTLDLVEMRNLRARLDGLLSVARGWLAAVFV